MLVGMSGVRKVVQQRHADPAAKPDRHQKRVNLLSAIFAAILKGHDAIKTTMTAEYSTLANDNSLSEIILLLSTGLKQISQKINLRCINPAEKRVRAFAPAGRLARCRLRRRDNFA